MVDPLQTILLKIKWFIAYSRLSELVGHLQTLHPCHEMAVPIQTIPAQKINS